jgi:hypothetical protein
LLIADHSNRNRDRVGTCDHNWAKCIRKPGRPAIGNRQLEIGNDLRLETSKRERGKEKTPRLRVRGVFLKLLENPQRLFSSFLRGASCLKSPRLSISKIRRPLYTTVDWPYQEDLWNDQQTYAN